ncbi:hypothetical protein [Glutamicibacter sp. NPDC090743]|uniref:hypothetical protein n=1 Tax=Glutamicibacter sp. NPDC090743 TaxID=3364001 RepID=UPI0037F8FAAC
MKMKATHDTPNHISTPMLNQVTGSLKPWLQHDLLENGVWLTCASPKATLHSLMSLLPRKTWISAHGSSSNSMNGSTFLCLTTLALLSVAKSEKIHLEPSLDFLRLSGNGRPCQGGHPKNLTRY